MNALKFFVGSLICLAILIALTMTYTRLVGYAPDEDSHFGIASHHIEKGSFPTWEDFRYGSRRGYAYQVFSPVGYWAYGGYALLTAESTKELQGRSKLLRYRAGGLLFAVLQFVLTFLICSYFVSSKTTAMLLSLAINLLPQLRYLHGYVTNDSFAILAGTFAFYVLVRFWKTEHISFWDSSLLGISIGAIAVSKPNTFLIAVSVFLLALVFMYHKPVQGNSRLRHLGIVFALTLSLSIWFYSWLALEIYNGSFWSLTGTGEHQALYQSTFRGRVSQGWAWVGLEKYLSLRAHEWEYLRGTYFGGMSKFSGLTGPILLSWTYIFGIGFALGIVSLLYSLFWSKQNSAHALSILLFGPAVMLLTYLALSIDSFLKIQGRLLLPLMVPTFLFVFFGLSRLFPSTILRPNVSLNLLSLGCSAYMLYGHYVILQPKLGW